MSLAVRQYYSNPQNNFWCVTSAALGVGPLGHGKPAERVIKRYHIALWDVFYRVRRKGSADAAIDLTTAVPNDFGRFLAKHPRIQLIVFNGRKAESHFRRFVVRKQPCLDGVATITLPSTSPANTRTTAAAKKQQWCRLRRWVAAGA
jgi:hypoxanthine-DNA glycosylase